MNSISNITAFGNVDNHFRARLLTLFEQIDKGEIEEGMLAWRYPLEPLHPNLCFLNPDCTPTDDDAPRAIHRLWDALLNGLKQILLHCANLPLWLDHFDALWLTVCHAIPAATAFGVKPEVSLYDSFQSNCGARCCALALASRARKGNRCRSKKWLG